MAPNATSFRSEFPILGRCVFMNHAGVSPLPARSAAALRQWLDQAQTSVGASWPLWNAALRRARAAGAGLLGASEDEIAFIPSTTHGLNIVAQSLAWRPGENVVTAEHEFPANSHPWRNLAPRGVALRVVREREDRRYDVQDFARAMDERTRLVSVSMVQYSSGYRMPVEAIARLCRERGALFCIDGIQAAGAMPVDVKAIGCDFFSADAHKWMLSAEGLGLLYIRSEILPQMGDAMTGWIGRVRPGDYHDVDQPLVAAARRFEEGSHAMALAAVLEQSLGLLLEVGADEVWRRIEALTARLCAGLEARGFEIRSPRGEGERSGVVAFHADGIDSPAWFRRLEKDGIHIAARRGWLRASPHFYNEPEQIDALLAALDKLRAAS